MILSMISVFCENWHQKKIVAKQHSTLYPPSPSFHSAPHSEPVIVPYLSPLTLRKEVENILETEGDGSLCRARFLQDHPICFWNLLFYFKRVDLNSHLAAFILHDKRIWGREEKVGQDLIGRQIRTLYLPKLRVMRDKSLAHILQPI